jgi:hypothetical protein
MSISCIIHEGSWIIATILLCLLVLVWFLSIFFYWSLSAIQKDNFDSVLTYWLYTDLGFWGIWLLAKLFIPGYGCS